MEDIRVSVLADYKDYWSIMKQEEVSCVSILFVLHFKLLLQTRDFFSVSFCVCLLCAMMLAILRWITKPSSVFIN